MSFDIPTDLFVLGAVDTANAQNTQRALQKQSAEMRQLLLLGKEIPCPYCQQFIAAGAFVCSQCQGVLSIGSWEAIRCLLQLDPSLAFRDAESFDRLRAKVQELDSYWTKLAAEEEVANQILLDQQMRELEAKMEHEREITAEKKRQYLEHVAGLPPMKRWMITHKPVMAGILSLLLVFIFLIGSNINQNHRRSQEMLGIKSMCKTLTPQIRTQVAQLEKLQREHEKWNLAADEWWASYGGDRRGWDAGIASAINDTNREMAYKPNPVLQESLSKIMSSLSTLMLDSESVLHSSQQIPELRFNLANQQYENAVKAYNKSWDLQDQILNGGFFEGFQYFLDVQKITNDGNLDNASVIPEIFFSSHMPDDTTPIREASQQNFNDTFYFPTYLATIDVWNGFNASCKALD